MKTEKVNIAEIKPNPDNPRTIKDEKFKKLVQSIKDFPEMLEIRPIVVNKEMVVLGGNMRLRACAEAGVKEVPIIKVSKLTKEQEKEFIIKDNASFGAWEWETLANEWDSEKLAEWGVDIPQYEEEEEAEEEDDYFSTFPLSIILNRQDYDKWNRYKKEKGIRKDLEAFKLLLKDIQ